MTANEGAENPRLIETGADEVYEASYMVIKTRALRRALLELAQDIEDARFHRARERLVAGSRLA